MGSGTELERWLPIEFPTLAHQSWDIVDPRPALLTIAYVGRSLEWSHA